MLHPDIAVVKQFHQALVSNDADALHEIIAEDASWISTGRSPFAGEHKGAVAIIDLVAKIHSLTNGSFRPWRDDSNDVMASEHHAVLMDRYLAEREGRQLDTHVIFVIVPEDGKIKLLLPYYGDQYAFDEFWV